MTQYQFFSQYLGKFLSNDLFLFWNSGNRIYLQSFLSSDHSSIHELEMYRIYFLDWIWLRHALVRHKYYPYKQGIHGEGRDLHTVFSDPQVNEFLFASMSTLPVEMSLFYMTSQMFWFIGTTHDVQSQLWLRRQVPANRLWTRLVMHFRKFAIALKSFTSDTGRIAKFSGRAQK